MGRRGADAGVRAGALGQSGAAPAGVDRKGGATARLSCRRSARTGLARSRGMVARRTRIVRASGPKARGTGVVIPIALPVLDRGRSRRGARGRAVRLGFARTAGRRLRARVCGSGRRALCLRCVKLHDRTASGLDWPLDIGPGDEVITASHSFIATANCIRYCGATPVFVDIDPDTYNIDPDRVAEAITPRTRAILAVHQMGMPCDLAALTALGGSPRHRADRGCRLCRRQPDPHQRRLGADRQAARRDRLLFLPSAQGDHDRRRRDADDRERRTSIASSGCFASTA